MTPSHANIKRIVSKVAMSLILAASAVTMTTGCEIDVKGSCTGDDCDFSVGMNGNVPAVTIGTTVIYNK
ncbi:MAG: hypothetical protein ABII12_03835 [Planctomycetota bacterium]